MRKKKAATPMSRRRDKTGRVTAIMVKPSNVPPGENPRRRRGSEGRASQRRRLPRSYQSSREILGAKGHEEEATGTHGTVHSAYGRDCGSSAEVFRPRRDDRGASQKGTPVSL